MAVVLENHEDIVKVKQYNRRNKRIIEVKNMSETVALEYEIMKLRGTIERMSTQQNKSIGLM